MRDYELTLVLRPSLEDEARDKFLGKVKKIVEDADGEVGSQDLWGKKSLAYPIKKEIDGIYAYFVLSMPEKEALSLEKKIKMEDAVLRHLLLRKD